MALTLYFHPLASYCHKVLVGLYENDIPFVPKVIDLFDPAQRAELERAWPLMKFPVLRDDTRGAIVPESTVILEYLDLHHRGPTRFVPADPEDAWRCRLLDRVFDLHVAEPMSKIVTDELRSEGRRDPEGVARARAALATTYAHLERELRDRTWATGERFTMADCAAAPALFYANEVAPFGEAHPVLGAYLGRLRARASFARVLDEVRPYWSMFPASRRSAP